MDLKDIQQAVSKYAPLLASVISQSNPLAGLIINAIAVRFGAAGNSPDTLTNIINTDPNAAEKLKEVELQHEALLMQGSVDDRKSAREREEKVTEITGKRDWLLDSIALLVILGYFIMCAVISFTKLDQSDHDVLYMMVGQLTSGFIMVLSYYFGSSNK